MRTFGRFLGRAVGGMVLIAAALWIFGPYEEISVSPTIFEVDVGADVDAYFEAQESRFDDITEGVEKRVIWAGEPGAKTKQAIVYMHGFSATSEEIRPVPDLVAEALGANLIYTRLQGHGRSGAAMADATVQGWADDFAEAMIVARRVAEEVFVIGTSTGGTVVAAMLDQPEVMEAINGVIFVSPNFEISASTATLLSLPAARFWVPLVAGENRSFETRSEGHEKYWTSQYPTVALMQMAALVSAVKDQDFSTATTPALFMFSDEDVVVKATATRAVAAQWGGPVTLAPQVLQAGSDPYSHVISGAIMSPAETESDVEEILLFINKI
ncbi:Thermostable monoacylglycerol lipase [Shimia sp. SK013]|uniref:alpha/beta hydrolase n=1 Tax=Shimia sp. SK013 TaxID=1389006 RepID=UPI0006B5DBCB|nr:alpha/beta fold hydrolase [Shimia sp. SK013]KPA22204.1 Thermostable monoacylglycerol lipase [Shimia sp. SK013]